MANLDGGKWEYCDFAVLCFDAFDDPRIIKTARCANCEFDAVNKKLKDRYEDKGVYRIVFKKQNIKMIE